MRTGALRAVNLGVDADKTGLVHGQLAGAYWGLVGIPDRWLEELALRETIIALAQWLFDHALQFVRSSNA